jgi:hypothetical protein
MKMASKCIKKYAPAILSSFDLSFTTHSGHFQSCDTIPLNRFGYPSDTWHVGINSHVKRTVGVHDLGVGSVGVHAVDVHSRARTAGACTARSCLAWACGLNKT